MTLIFFFCFNLDDHHLTRYEIKKIKTVGFLNSFELKLISLARKIFDSHSPEKNSSHNHRKDC